MIFLIKVVLGFMFYDFIFKSLIKAFTIVLLRHSKGARRLFDKFKNWAIKNGHYEQEQGGE